ncbi:MAG: hypothetical protein R3F39_14900 [Myxococcota bacterium]
MASVDYVAGVASGIASAEARLPLAGGDLVALADVALSAADPDLAVFTLDITFHDPATSALYIIPGDIDPVTAGEILEVRANVPKHRRRRLTRRRRRALRGRPGLVFAPRRLRAHPRRGRDLPAIPAGGSTVLAIQSVFLDEGFHTMTVVLDPSGTLPELSEANNRGTQAFWIGEPSVGSGDIIQTQCSLVSVRGTAVAGVPTTSPGGALPGGGRADTPRSCPSARPARSASPRSAAASFASP